MLKKYNYNQLFSIKKVNKIVDTNSVGGASYDILILEEEVLVGEVMEEIA